MVSQSNMTGLPRNVSSCRFSSQKRIWTTRNLSPICEIDFVKQLHLKHRKRSGGKSSYRHVPHNQRPPHLVARRNARERRRVQAVNKAFTKLRRYVPYEPKHKRLSKVKTLRIAIDYIRCLSVMIEDHDRRCHEQAQGFCPSAIMDANQQSGGFYSGVSSDCVSTTLSNIPDASYSYPSGWVCGTNVESHTQFSDGLQIPDISSSCSSMYVCNIP